MVMMLTLMLMVVGGCWLDFIIIYSVHVIILRFSNCEGYGFMGGAFGSAALATDQTQTKGTAWVPAKLNPKL